MGIDADHGEFVFDFDTCHLYLDQSFIPENPVQYISGDLFDLGRNVFDILRNQKAEK